MTVDRHDAVWDAAWNWVQREHDHEHFDDASRAALTSWLVENAAHREAYEKAARLWMLAGLVPPASDLDDAPSPASSPDLH